MSSKDRIPPAPPNAHPVRSKPRIGGVVFHFLASAVMLNGFKGLQHMPISDYMKGPYGNHSQFLTIWGLFLSILTTTLGLASNMLPGLKILRNMKRMSLLLALPLSMTISVIYWSLIFLAPNLILPPKSAFSNHPSPDPASTSSSGGNQGAPSSSSDVPDLMRIPLWIDVSLHAIPALVMAIEFFLREKKYRPPVSTKGAIVLSALLSLSYVVVIERTAGISGSFPYPFLPADNLGARVVIYVAATGFAYLAFKGLNGLHR